MSVWLTLLLCYCPVKISFDKFSNKFRRNNFCFFFWFFPFLKNTLGEESEERDVISTEPPTPHNLIVSEHEDEEEDYEHDVDEEEDFSLDDIATDPEDDDEDDDDKPKEFPPEVDGEGEETGVQATGK